VVVDGLDKLQDGARAQVTMNDSTASGSQAGK